MARARELVAPALSLALFCVVFWAGKQHGAREAHELIAEANSACVVPAYQPTITDLALHQWAHPFPQHPYERIRE